jgi:AcrR family transcriptional regulator
MPRPRFERAAPEKREAVLDAAAEEFAAHGYEAASVNRILAAAGFSKGSFYYYFDDKADLAAAVLVREAERYLARWPELRAPKTRAGFWRAVQALVDDSEALARERPRAVDALSRLGAAAASDPDLLARLTGSALADVTARARDFWTLGRELGAVRDDLSVATLMAILQSVKLALTTVLLPADRAPTAEEYQRFVRIHFDLVRRFAERAATTTTTATTATTAAPRRKGRAR